MDVIEQLAGKAREATVAANDISRPLSARMSAMNDAMAYGDRMKVARTALQKERAADRGAYATACPALRLSWSAAIGRTEIVILRSPACGASRSQ
ncbi:hypothetical protein V2V90_23235 (plasmid) [Agrobacterium leguminum]|uniref:hypothetical protein n=1 Tax=Agrobacterium leguminum TaxID=2792015 RepID=UPI0030CEB6B2